MDYCTGLDWILNQTFHSLYVDLYLVALVLYCSYYISYPLHGSRGQLFILLYNFLCKPQALETANTI